MLERQCDVLVVGAGPAGLLAGGFAAKAGCSTVILESRQRPARKLGITGKGRCNVTNARPIQEYADHVFQGFEFLQPAFSFFSNQGIVELLARQGVPTVVERGQRVFPTSGKARDVVDALVAWTTAQGAELITGAQVQRIRPMDDGTFRVRALPSEGARLRLRAKTVVVATGGLSYPATGSTGFGFELARLLYIDVVPPVPSLVGITLAEPIRNARNLLIKNVQLSLLDGSRQLAEAFGDLMLTDRGFDGPVALQLSRYVSTWPGPGHLTLRLDLKPALSPEKLLGRMGREREARPYEPLLSSLRALLPNPLVAPVLLRVGVPRRAGWAALSPAQLQQLALTIKGMDFGVSGCEGWYRAIVTAGGIALDQLDPTTLRCHQYPHLYFCGEVLDADATTGGYNLQIAYSTGALAGHSAAMDAKNRPALAPVGAQGAPLREECK